MHNQPPYRVYLCNGPHCSSKGVNALRTQLETALWEYQLEGRVELRLSGCQDCCDYGPNLIVYPGSYRYARLTAATLTQIVAQHLRTNEPVQQLLAPPELRRRR